MQTDQKTISTDFVCAYEVHDKTTFQSQGHFVSGLKDDYGFRREWQSGEVHVLTLNFQGEQVLRIMSDSLESACNLMSAELKASYMGLWTAQYLQGHSYDAFVRQRERLAELQAFIDEQYAEEIKRGQHGGFQDSVAVAMYYMGKERERAVDVFDLKTNEPINRATGKPYKTRTAAKPAKRKAAKR